MMLMKSQIQRSTVVSRRSQCVVRCNPSPPPPPPAAGPSVTPQPVSTPAGGPAALRSADDENSSKYDPFRPITVTQAMAFSGAPEAVNGRLSMLAVVTGLAAELASRESVYSQFREALLPVLVLTLAVSIGSIIPLVKGADMRQAVGPFTPSAEKLNGRVAMVGLAALLVIEGLSGKALIS